MSATLLLKGEPSSSHWIIKSAKRLTAMSLGGATSSALKEIDLGSKILDMEPGD